MPPHQPERAKDLPGEKMVVTIQLQLQISSSTGGVEAVQTWRLPQGSWGADTELGPSMVSVVDLLPLRPSAEELTQAGSSIEATEEGWP